jgi:hypothetical protein
MRRISLLLALACVTAAGAPPQETPDLFDLSKTSVDKAAAATVGADLAEYALAQARSIPNYHIFGDYRKLIRVAYQLASSDPSVLAAHARIRTGQAPEAPRREVLRDDLLRGLIPLVTKAREGKLKDDLTAAKYLCAVGVLIDPQNEGCLVESDKLSKRGGVDVPWDRALAVYRLNVPDGSASNINGLVVMTSAGSAEVGAVSRIVMTYRASGSQALGVKLLREGADKTQVSMEEAIRYWERIRKSVPLPGGTLEVSFEDKFSKKDGPSAGAAFAVLLRSFSDPFQIDPAFAMTGDVSVEGRLLQIGGAFAKVRGAVNGRCERVGIPLVNELELIDGLVMNGPATLGEIEIYGLETIEDAVALARVDRDEKVRQASTSFASLKTAFDKKLKTSDTAATADIQKHAAAVLALAPRHLSAKLINAWNLRTLPRTLSLAASLDEAHDVFYGYLMVIRSGEGPSFKDVAEEPKTTNVNETLRKLREVMPKLHPDAQKGATKLENCCLQIQRYIQARAPLDRQEKKCDDLEKQISDLKLKIERARAENKSTEEVNRLVKRHNSLVEDRKQEVDKYNKSAKERVAMFEKVIEIYNEYIVIVRSLSQDPKLLEKLQNGK